MTRDAQPGAPPSRVRMSARFERGQSLLPLPAGTTRIAAFPATQMRRNGLGAAHASLAVDWANYEAQVVPGLASYSPPTEEDALVPAEERTVLEGVVAELGLRELAPAERLRRIEQHLGSFAYSTFRDRPVAAGQTALGDFLTRTRAGHCEYFATAATLLARAAGVPARYATGFAAIEYSPLEGAWVVRTRHAHAWSRAWVDGRWMDLDTTPASWGAEEESEAPVWQGLADLLRYAGFRWSQRGEFKFSDGWYAVLGVLALYLGWSVLRGRRVVREKRAAEAVPRRWPGEDSEFYALAGTLPAREANETHAAWMKRIDRRDSAENGGPIPRGAAAAPALPLRSGRPVAQRAQPPAGVVPWIGGRALKKFMAWRVPGAFCRPPPPARDRARRALPGQCAAGRSAGAPPRARATHRRAGGRSASVFPACRPRARPDRDRAPRAARNCRGTR